MRIERLALLLALTALALPGAMAAERQSAAASPYRLVVATPASYRLAGGEPYRLAAAPRPAAAALAELPFAAEIATAAREADLDPALLHALIHVESRHQALALSPKGAIGLMQVMPDTAARFGVAHPDQSVAANLKAGSAYLRNLFQQFDGRIDLVLAAYNAGEGAVLRHAMAIPPYAETQRYVPAVLAKYEEWRDAPNVVRPIEYLAGTRLTPLRW